MSLLQDKHFEDLDFISQAVEPFYHPALDFFKTIPDEIHIPTSELAGIVTNRYGDIKALDEHALEKRIRQAIESIDGMSEFNDICNKFYDIKLNDISYDVYDDTLLGSVTLTKKADCPLTQEMIGQELSSIILDSMRSYDKTLLSKKDLLDFSSLFLGDEITKSIIDDKLRHKQMWYSIINKVSLLFTGKNIKYRIRGYDAASKLSKNISDFVEGRNPERAMANLTLFKMVMDKGNAIYSLQEIGQ